MPKARKHLLILAVLVLVATAALAYLFLQFSFLPIPASSQASTIDKLFSAMFAIAGFFLALCLIAMLYAAIAFRRRRGDASDGPPIQGNVALETAWILIPLAIVIGLGVVGGLALEKISAAPEESELEVKVTALQWAWLFEYPEWGVRSGELRLPVDRPVLFRLTSRDNDVVHSFWVPEFRVKQDAVPGRETALRVTPNAVGDYQLLCAELCGLGHAYMRASARVVPEADFMAWIESLKQ
ncbi:MAG: cytochrome c oxidase subunit II [Chloroflexi bacterium]|nr:cytochrome c oxidase subunit II [Chloroflexota bacterium]